MASPKLHIPAASQEEIAKVTGEIARAMLSATNTMSWEDAIFAAGLAIKGFSTVVASVNAHVNLSPAELNLHVAGIVGTAMQHSVQLAVTPDGPLVSDMGRGVMQ